MPPRAGEAEEPMRPAAEDADKRRGLKRSAQLPPDDGARDRAPGRGVHLDNDVPIVTAIVQQVERRADAADAHMCVVKIDMISKAAAQMTISAAAGELTTIRVKVRKQVHKLQHQFKSP